MKLSYHSKQRLKERLGDWNEQEWENIVKYAYIKGKTFGRFPEGSKIRTYLHRRTKGCNRVVMYRNVCFVFAIGSKYNKRRELITAYPIPDWVLEK